MGGAAARDVRPIWHLWAIRKNNLVRYNRGSQHRQAVDGPPLRGLANLYLDNRSPKNVQKETPDRTSLCR